MKRRFTILTAALALLVFMMPSMVAWGQTRESYSVTYGVDDLEGMFEDGSSYASANGYWKVPASADNIAMISIPITQQPESNITVTFHIATFGTGDNPSASNTTISAIGTETGSNWTGSGVSSYPSSSTYVDGVMTITKPANPTTLGGLDITMGVNAGVKIFRLQSITVAYTYGGGSTPTTYTVTFDAGDGTFVSNTDFPSTTNTKEAGSYTLPSATRDNYTFDGWLLVGSPTPVTGNYTVSSDVDFTAQYTENTPPTPGGETITFDFEDEGAHRPNTSNNYTSQNTYSENGASITLMYADAVTTGTPLNGSANVLGRIAKNTTNSPTIHIGSIDITNKTITKIEYDTKGMGAMSQVFEYSLDNSNWTSLLTLSSMPTSATTETADNLSITGTNLYLRWTTSVSSSTGSNRDFQLDDIVITYINSSNPVPTISASNVSIAYDATSGAIEYTINNAVEGGALIASTEDEWLTIGTVGTTVPFTCTTNEGDERTATVTLTYTYNRETVTKDVTITQAANPNVPGTQNNPYTIAQAHAAIDAGTGTQGVYATGIVSAIPTAFSTQYGNITFNMVDEEGAEVFLQAYRCTGDQAANVQIGDIAVVYGNLTKYGSTYEFEQGCTLVSLTHITTIVADDVTISDEATSGSIVYTINNPVEGGTMSATTTSDWLTLGNSFDNPIAFTCSANTASTARTATVTLTYTFNRESKTKNVIVTQNGNAYVNISTITEVGAEYSVRGTVVATNSRGFIMGDGTGYVYYYNNGTVSQSIGDKVTVSGTIGSYGHVIQFTNTASVTSTSISNYDYTPAANVITEVPDYNEGYYLSTYMEFQGVLGKANNNYLITLGEAQIQISYPTTEQDDALTALDGKTVRVKGYFTGISSSKFTVMLESVEEVYTLTINGYEAGSDGGYYLITTPVTVDPATVAGMTEGEFDLYQFNQSADKEWENWNVHHFNLVPGKGYLYAKQATTPNEVFQFELTGTPYDGTPICLSKTGNGPFVGWNLVGNPFNQNLYLDRDFYIMGDDGDEIIASNSAEVTPMQGFFVIADEDGEELHFIAPLDPIKLVINVSKDRGNLIDRAIVRFDEGRQLPKFQLNPNNTKIYVTEGNQDFAVVRSANEGEMPVSFKAAENGTYTISVNTENMEMDYLHLIDNMTGTTVDLLQTPSYTFEASTRDYASRFRLVFSADENGASAGSATFAYFNGNEWVVSNEGDAQLHVIDMTGRIVSTETINGNATVKVNAAPGVYMLRLVNGNDIKTQKVIIK